MARFKKHTAFLLASLCIVYFFRNYIFLRGVTHSNLKTKYNSISKNVNYLKPDFTILFWNTPGWIREQYAEVNFTTCPTTVNCQLSFDRDVFHKSDAVVFSVGNTGLGKPPVSRYERNPNQPWVFFTLESPKQVDDAYKDEGWKNVFNFSWSYRSDADFVFQYGKIKRRQHTLHKNYSRIFHEKRKFAIWIVSHCKTQSQRETYVKFLKNFINVDTFGKCGDSGRTKGKKLHRMVNNEYKFYFAFENSHCKDYVTEKFLYYFNYDVITIVRGAYNYSLHYPQGTFINTADFSSVEKLANYLKYLAENEEEYTKILKAKDMYIGLGFESTFSESFCSVCRKLSGPGVERRTYDDVDAWLGECSNITDLKLYETNNLINAENSLKRE